MNLIVKFLTNFRIQHFCIHLQKTMYIDLKSLAWLLRRWPVAFPFAKFMAVIGQHEDAIFGKRSRIEHRQRERRRRERQEETGALLQLSVEDNRLGPGAQAAGGSFARAAKLAVAAPRAAWLAPRPPLGAS